MPLNVVLVSILPVRKPAPSGLNGTKPIPSSSQAAEHAVVLHVASPQGVLALNGGDRVDRMGAADRLGTRLGQPEVLHLAVLNQFLHGAGDVLDGYVRVHTVLIQQVDGGHVQALQHRVDDLTNVLGSAVDAMARAVRVDPESELGGDHDFFAQRRQRLADELFVRERTVGFSGIEERHAALDRGVHEGDGLLPAAGGTIDPGESHAAVPDRRDLQPAGAKRALLHAAPSLSVP